jgi:hypothetical protein
MFFNWIINNVCRETLPIAVAGSASLITQPDCEVDPVDHLADVPFFERKTD